MKNCNIYKHTFENVYTEEQAPKKDALRFLFSQANYKQEIGDFVACDEAKREYDILMNKEEYNIFYKDIQDISDADAKFIKKKMCTNENTVEESLQLTKYYFNKIFVTDAQQLSMIYEDEQVNVLEFIFDNKLTKMVKKIILLDEYPENVFNQIMELNKLKNIFPVDIKQTKLNNTMKIFICKKFKFLKLNEKSSNNLLIKEIYNQFFESIIIKSHTDKKQGVTNYIIENDLITIIYDFIRLYATKLEIRPKSYYDEETETIKFVTTLVYDERFIKNKKNKIIENESESESEENYNTFDEIINEKDFILVEDDTEEDAEEIEKQNKIERNKQYEIERKEMDIRYEVINVMNFIKDKLEIIHNENTQTTQGVYFNHTMTFDNKTNPIIDFYNPCK
jgi:hypothetical protein